MPSSCCRLTPWLQLLDELVLERMRRRGWIETRESRSEWRWIGRGVDSVVEQGECVKRRGRGGKGVVVIVVGREEGSFEKVMLVVMRERGAGMRK
jgi:hypothetical protein